MLPQWCGTHRSRSQLPHSISLAGEGGALLLCKRYPHSPSPFHHRSHPKALFFENFLLFAFPSLCQRPSPLTPSLIRPSPVTPDHPASPSPQASDSKEPASAPGLPSAVQGHPPPSQPSPLYSHPFPLPISSRLGYRAWKRLTIPAVATVTALVARARRGQCACALLGVRRGSLPAPLSFLSALRWLERGIVGRRGGRPGPPAPLPIAPQ